MSLRSLSPENDPRQPLRPHSPERHQRGATHLTSNTEPPLPPAALGPLARSPPAKPPALTLPVPGPRPASPEPHRTASPLTGRPAGKRCAPAQGSVFGVSPSWLTVTTSYHASAELPLQPIPGAHRPRPGTALRGQLLQPASRKEAGPPPELTQSAGARGKTKQYVEFEWSRGVRFGCERRQVAGSYKHVCFPLCPAP